MGFSSEGPAAPRVAIRAWRLVTALGSDERAWHALLNGGHVLDHATCHGGRLPNEPRALSLARDVASGLARTGLDPGAALVVGTSKGSVENWLTPLATTAGAPPDGDALVGRRRLGLGDIAADLAQGYGLHGPRLTVSAACASGLHALIRGVMMIQAGEVRQALVVAAEASVHPLFLGSFQRLGVLARPGVGCRPFDRTREGFVMSEAAAAVLLEAVEPGGGGRGGGNGSASRSVFVDRFAMAGDGTHLTAGDPDTRVLRHILSRVADGPPVDLVHAHGTGTPTNDEAELAAIEAVAGAQAAKPLLYSHKGALGHSLGAAGLVSVVLNCHAHATGMVPPNVQTRDPLPTSRVVLSPGRVHRPVYRSVAMAAGFGGAMAAVSLSRDS